MKLTQAELIQRILSVREKLRNITYSETATTYSSNQAHDAGRELDELMAELKPEPPMTPEQHNAHPQGRN